MKKPEAENLVQQSLSYNRLKNPCDLTVLVIVYILLPIQEMM
jgi:hypothetical protein